MKWLFYVIVFVYMFYRAGIYIFWQIFLIEILNVRYWIDKYWTVLMKPVWNCIRCKQLGLIWWGTAGKGGSEGKHPKDELNAFETKCQEHAKVLTIEISEGCLMPTNLNGQRKKNVDIIISLSKWVRRIHLSLMVT